MKIALTKGMDGRTVKVIDAKCKTAKDAFGIISAWKSAAKEDGTYRICHYDRIIYKNDEHKLVIDFGDYAYFIVVKCSKKEWKNIEEWNARPIDLEV